MYDNYSDLLTGTSQPLLCFNIQWSSSHLLTVHNCTSPLCVWCCWPFEHLSYGLFRKACLKVKCTQEMKECKKSGFVNLWKREPYNAAQENPTKTRRTFLLRTLRCQNSRLVKGLCIHVINHGEREKKNLVHEVISSARSGLALRAHRNTRELDNGEWVWARPKSSYFFLPLPPAPRLSPSAVAASRRKLCLGSSPLETVCRN